MRNILDFIETGVFLGKPCSLESKTPEKRMITKIHCQKYPNSDINIERSFCRPKNQRRRPHYDTPEEIQTETAVGYDQPPDKRRPKFYNNGGFYSIDSFHPVKSFWRSE